MTGFRPWRLVAAVLTGLVFLSGGDAWAADGRVVGKVQYEKILYRNPETGVSGLQLDRPVLRPVVGAKVELVDVSNVVLATGITNTTGAYDLSWSLPAAPTARVRVVAAADNVVVVDHYNPETAYSVTSETWMLPEGETVKDITAVDKTRESGPFNILAVIQIGNKLVRSAEPDIAFPTITIHWSTRPRSGTTYFVRGRNQAFILGDRSQDSDEFDDSIILHEYGHYLAHVFSKDDSPGGSHSGRERLDPRLAWGEGWATFFACAALDDAHYIDTGIGGYEAGVLLKFDIDQDRLNGDRAGYWSEYSVASALWDLYDSRPGKLHVGLGFAEIWKIVRGKAWLERPGYRNLIDFCDDLVAAKPELGPRVADVLAARSIVYTPGASPSVADPYVRTLAPGKTLEGDVSSIGTLKLNKLEARAAFTFTLTEKTKVKLHLEIVGSRTKDNADLDLLLVDVAGRIIKVSNETNGIGGTETIEVELAPGVYFVEVQSFARVRGSLVLNSGSYRLRADY